jgi:ubiquinone/menaquinone biosynthesis C-methylase UbiE
MVRPGSKASLHEEPGMQGAGEREAMERIRRVYGKAAPKYDRGMAWCDRLLFKEGRTWVCSRARGETLEVGIGTGLDIPHYPAEVELTGLDASPEMLAVAERRAAELGRKVRLVLGDAQALEFPDASFDTVVFALSLCTIPHDRTAVAEARRVLRPGGRLLLLEHVRSPNRTVRLFQRLIDPLMVRFQADHQLREPLDHVLAEGFEVEDARRSKWGMVEVLAARKPDPAS